MTQAESKNLKYGDKVYYHNTPAIVQCVRANGVRISYDGQGAKRGQYVTETVPSAYIHLTAI